MSSPNDIRAGGAYVELYAKESGLADVLDAAREKVEALGQAIVAIGSKLSTYGGGLAAIIGGPVSLGLVTRALDAIKSSADKAMGSMIVNAERLNSEMQRIGLVGVDTAVKIRSDFQTTSAVLFGMMKRVGGELAVSVMPQIQAASDKLIRIASQVATWIQRNRELVGTVFSVAAKVAAAGGVLIAVGKGLGYLGPVFSLLKITLPVMAAAIGGMVTPLGLVVAGFAAMGAGIAYWSGVSGKVLAWLREKFTWFRDEVLDAYDAIVNALEAGEIEAVFGLVWAGVKLTWVQSKEWMIGTWNSLIFSLQDVWTNFRFFIEDAIVVAVSAVERTWVSMVSTMKRVFNTFIRDITIGWKTWTSEIAKVMVNISPTMGFGGITKEEAAATSAQIDRSLNRDVDRAMNEHDAQQKEIDAKEQSRKNEIEAKRNEVLAISDKQRQAQIAARRNPSGDGANGADKPSSPEVAAAVEEYNRAYNRVKSIKPPDKVDPRKVDLSAPGNSIATGSFSAIAASFMGADGGAAKRTADNTAAIKAQLYKMTTIMRTGEFIKVGG